MVLSDRIKVRVVFRNAEKQIFVLHKNQLFNKNTTCNHNGDSTLGAVSTVLEESWRKDKIQLAGNKKFVLVLWLWKAFQGVSPGASARCQEK